MADLADKDDVAEKDHAAPYFEEEERAKASAHTPLRPRLIHEIIREEGEAELRRPVSALAWSGLASGLSMGFSFLTQALLRSSLPDEPWRHLIDSFGYCVGFIIVVLGRQQLFTESTLTAVLPVLARRDKATAIATLTDPSILRTGHPARHPSFTCPRPPQSADQPSSPATHTPPATAGSFCAA